GRSISRSRDIPGDGLVETSLRLPPVERDYDASFWQTFEVRCRLGECLPEVPLINDVVAVEDRPRPMAADLHGDRHVNPRPHHVPHSCSTEVVQELSG